MMDQTYMADLLRKLKVYGSQLKAHERHISALAMLSGFVCDSLTYGRLDHAVTQTLLLIYIAVAAGTILILHYLEARRDLDAPITQKIRGLLPAVTQFAFGSLWSAFLVFYARSGVFATSWPFLILLLIIFVSNEMLRTYHSRLIFTAILLAFALLSYAIFMVPVFTHTIGESTFIGSGFVAALVYLCFLWLIGKLDPERWHAVREAVYGGAIAVFAAIYLLYFLNVLPPLPLAMEKAGVYTQIRREGQTYYATTEPQSWETWLGAPNVLHVAEGQPVYAFSAIFAPIKLSTRVIHVWQRYDTEAGEWHMVLRRGYDIVGGRSRGYRGYTLKRNIAPGLWRVDVQTIDGRIIGRMKFEIVRGKAAGEKTIAIR